MMATLNPDLSKATCRVCLKNNDDEDTMSSIFDVDSDFYDLHIYEKIEQCASIKLLRHEKVPTLICDDCYGLLRVSYKFRTICRNSNEYLKNCIALESKSSKATESNEPNPLSIIENISKMEEIHSQYKTKLIDRQQPLPETIKNIKDSPSNSTTNSEDFIVFNFADEVEGDWFDMDDENDKSCSESIKVENFDIDIEEEAVKEVEKEDEQIKKPVKPTKKSNVKAKNPSLEVFADDEAIIHEKKSGTKRGKKEKQPHICEVCGNIYQHRYSLELHMRRHRNEKPFSCEICAHAFHSNFQLIRHMRKHTGSRPYKCSYCPRAFGDQSTLIKHERVHRNERPFKCETCGKSFSYTGVLKYHKLVHTGEKPYVCELCGKCFPRAHNLRAHLETLQHQSDPRSKILLQNIRKNNEAETLKIKNLKLKI